VPGVLLLRFSAHGLPLHSAGSQQQHREELSKDGREETNAEKAWGGRREGVVYRYPILVS